ncbi:MAG: hypothetical protein CV087_16340 [Candidatus Brocadia sp. WS118]|nr:MAG: hypothetical protein CV087_16340 [Candidatus Brocadia sp. WS118]
MKKISLVIVIQVAIVISVLIFFNSRIPKVVYVKSLKVLEEYQGMKEVREVLSDFISKGDIQLDSLKKNLKEISVQIESKNITSSEKKRLEEIYNNKQSEMNQYIIQLRDEAKQEEQKLTQGVLNQINSYIKTYAEQKGYDLVIGVTLSGNVLYGSEALDITDEIIVFLNNNYVKNNHE